MEGSEKISFFMLITVWPNVPESDYTSCRHHLYSTSNITSGHRAESQWERKTAAEKLTFMHRKMEA